MIQGKKITVRLDTELVDGLQAYADNERVPVSWVLRHLVLRFLRPPSPSAQGGVVPSGDGSPLGKKGGQGRFPPTEAAARRLAASTRAERERDDFRDKVCAIFDAFRVQGLDAKEAAKRTNFAMKAEKHPWAVYDVVAGVLRDEGRFRKGKVPRS